MKGDHLPGVVGSKGKLGIVWQTNSARIYSSAHVCYNPDRLEKQVGHYWQRATYMCLSFWLPKSDSFFFVVKEARGCYIRQLLHIAHNAKLKDLEKAL